MSFLRTMSRVVFATVQAIVKPLLLLPLIFGVMGFNYTVGNSIIPVEDRYDIEVAKAMLAGENLLWNEQLDERKIMARYVEYLEYPPQTIALGSSRVLQLNRSVAGDVSFYNCGMSGSDFYDILGTFYLFDRADKLPKNMIIALDPWLLNGDATSKRSDKDLYNEFLTLKLGVDAGYAPPPPDEIDYIKLMSPEYFRSNWEYYYQDKVDAPLDLLLNGNLYEQATSTKLDDGSILYSEGFRNVDVETVEATARVDAGNFLWMEDYTSPDPARCDIFRKFVQYATGRGVNVIFVLSPYHPTVYSFATENRHRYPGFFLTEPWFMDYAQKNDIPLYGSYNPFVADCWTEDFYDGLHIRGESLARVFPGVQQVFQQQEQGRAGSPYVVNQPRISPENALKIAQYYTPIQEPHIYSVGESTLEVEGSTCYLIERYASSAQGATRLALYAITVDEGVYYRFDTNKGSWVIDPRF